MSSRRTPHGFASADDFLVKHFEIDKGRVKTKLRLDYGRHKLLIQISRRALHWIKTDFSWSGEPVPNEKELKNYPILVTPSLSGDKRLNRFITLKIEGLDQLSQAGKEPIPNVCISSIRLMDDYFNDGYFPSDSLIYKEFARRWRIEAAFEQMITTRDRLKRLRAEGPYVVD